MKIRESEDNPNWKIFSENDAPPHASCTVVRRGEAQLGLSRHRMLNQGWFNVGPPSATLDLAGLHHAVQRYKKRTSPRRTTVQEAYITTPYNGTRSVHHHAVQRYKKRTSPRRTTVQEAYITTPYNGTRSVHHHAVQRYKKRTSPRRTTVQEAYITTPYNGTRSVHRHLESVGQNNWLMINWKKQRHYSR